MTTASSPLRVEALFLGAAKEINAEGTGEWWDKSWRTGYHKLPQTQPAWLGYEGFHGDEQADRRHHGGVDKAVCAYALAHYDAWRDELELPELPLGAFGENLTLRGLTEDTVCIGDVFSLGAAVVQVSQPRQPCWKLARRWRIKDFVTRVEQTGRTGFYFRVIQHGLVAPGAELRLVERMQPQWSIAACNQVMHHQQHDRLAARALSECRELSGSWKDQLWRRAAGADDSTATRRSGGD